MSICRSIDWFSVAEMNTELLGDRLITSTAHLFPAILGTPSLNYATNDRHAVHFIYKSCQLLERIPRGDESSTVDERIGLIEPQNSGL